MTRHPARHSAFGRTSRHLRDRIYAPYFVAGAVCATFSLPGVDNLVRYGKNGVISNGIFSRAEARATGFALANST